MDYGLGEKAIDGNSYVHVLGPPLGLLNIYRLILECRALAQQIPGPEGKARSAAVGLLLIQLEADVAAASKATAVATDDAIRDAIAKTQVRPATPKTQHLGDAIQSRAPASVPPSWEIGVADIDKLNDEAVDDSNRPYWRAQELGSSHLVGKRLTGFFAEPGASLPSQAEFRNHAIFEQDSGGGAMLIQRPIPARHFIAAGVAAAVAFRKAEASALDTQIAGEVRAIGVGTHAFVDRARRAARRRLP